MAVAAKWAVITLVSGAIVAAAVVLWELRTVLMLALVAFTIAAGMRKSVEWLRGHGVPASLAILLHYTVLLAMVARSCGPAFKESFGGTVAWAGEPATAARAGRRPTRKRVRVPPSLV